MVKYRFSIAFYKKGWLKTVSFTYNKQDCFDIEKRRNKRKVTGYRNSERYNRRVLGDQRTCQRNEPCGRRKI